MPIIKSAIKKMHQDRKRRQVNLLVKEAYKKALKHAKKSPTQKTISGAFSALDTAAKKHIIHKNKAARLKSSLSHLLSK
ncbi:30S ribosomal protein S20 [Candidatus Microgenomates bacterium]|nr:MAG: 30S ribosomal protein S20 [Candidatus Microgenomates bacterium]